MYIFLTHPQYQLKLSAHEVPNKSQQAKPQAVQGLFWYLYSQGDQLLPKSGFL